MSDTTPTLRVGTQEHSSFRVYLQADGRYKAIGTVERAGQPRKDVTSSEHTSAGQALAEALQMSGFLDP